MSREIKIKQDNVPHCPVCNSVLDAHTGTDGTSVLPMDGDASICFNCVTVLAYEITSDGIGVRIPTEEEQKAFDADKDISRIVEIMKQVKNSDQGMP